MAFYVTGTDYKLFCNEKLSVDHGGEWPNKYIHECQVNVSCLQRHGIQVDFDWEFFNAQDKQPMKVPLCEMEKRQKQIQRRHKRPPKTKQVQTDAKTRIEREEEAIALLKQVRVVVEGMTLDEVIKLHEESEDKAFRRALRIKIAMMHITGKSELDRKYEFENFLIKYAKLKDISLNAWSGFVKALSEKANGVEYL